MKTQLFISKRSFFALVFGIFTLGLAQIHVRINTTLVGYRLGALKTRESELLIERSRLKMEYQE